MTDIFSKALSLAGFSTTAVSSGSEAIEILKTIRPAMILLDLHLPGIPGDKVLSEIRQHDHLKDSQVVLATADPAMADMLRAESDYVLEKPISFGQLRDLATRIRQVL
jgi:CheY-like chemotaxis protein